MLDCGTPPQVRESQDSARLSPIVKYCPSGTLQVSPKCWLSTRRFCALTYGSWSRTNVDEPGFLIQMYPWSSSRTVSPGRPITRFTKTPPSPHLSAASSGVLKTTMSPRDGLPRRRQTRQASTRSFVSPRQPGPVGPFEQLSVGSIAELGV